MRNMMRTTLLALLATLASSAVTTVSAQASACPAAGTRLAFCIEGQEITREVSYAAANASGSVATFSFAGGYTVTCSKVSDHGSFLPSGAGVIGVSKRVIEFNLCTVSVNHCAIAEPLVFGKEGGATGLVGEVSFGTGGFNLVAFPAAGGHVFGTITFKNKSGSCTIGGEYKISGEEGRSGVGPVCSLPAVTTEAVEHSALCLHGKSHLSGGFGGGTLGLDMEEKISLAGGDAGKQWRLVES